jgi:ATP-dependent exoDNAse (exonuclease V) beta subunit
VSFPSGLAAPPEATATLPETEPAEDGDAARLRGVIMHRALQTLALGGAVPAAPSLAAALRQEGLTAPAAAALAVEIQAELAACQADPVLTSLLRPDIPGAASEWFLEDQPHPGAIRRGMIDHLSFDGQDWWLLDYKSSRPADGEDWEAFLRRETDKYRPQLLAYREMAARAKGIDPPAAIRLVLYFTACRRAVEV